MMLFCLHGGILPLFQLCCQLPAAAAVLSWHVHGGHSPLKPSHMHPRRMPFNVYVGVIITLRRSVCAMVCGDGLFGRSKAAAADRPWCVIMVRLLQTRLIPSRLTQRALPIVHLSVCELGCRRRLQCLPAFVLAKSAHIAAGKAEHNATEEGALNA